MRCAAVAAIAAALCAPAHAGGACSARSPAHTVALIELYTSEGCDSCPPADRWLSRIGESGLGTDAVVPLSLHVDYWDRLGWKDRFAAARFTERQRDLARLAQSRTIYTPEVFVGLREMRAWGSAAQFRQAVKAINAIPAGAEIRLQLEPASATQLPLRADFALAAGAGARRPQAYVALFENRLSSEVKAGENRGVTLAHDYVVREWLGPLEMRDGKATYAGSLALDAQWKRVDLGVAAFVQDSGNARILQALALPLCR